MAKIFQLSPDPEMDFLLKIVLGIYSAAWIGAIGLILHGAWLLAILTAMAYVGAHAYMNLRNFCFLDSDQMAFPVSAVAYIAFSFALWSLDLLPSNPAPRGSVFLDYAIPYLVAYVFAWFSGNAAVFGFVFLGEKLKFLSKDKR